MATVPNLAHVFTAGEYLTFERCMLTRHEWLDGVIYDMAGESQSHARICMNLSGILYAALRGTPCEAYSKDVKVLSGSTHADSQHGVFSYPDLVVVCGESRYLDPHQDVLLNPRVIIEVLSPSTQAFDRGEKQERYFAYLETLEDYMLVSQDRPQVEHWHKTATGVWQAVRLEGIEATLTLEGIGVQLPLVEVYERVAFVGR